MNADLRSRCALRVLFLVGLVGGASHANAHLNSFTPADGYAPQYGSITGDVTYYNAGQYGANSGGGSGPTFLLPDSGLWELTSPVGGYFASAVNRLSYTATAPAYAPTDPNGVGAYAVGGHFGGRTDAYNLALRNDTPLGTGAMEYDYNLDSYDFGGVTPASVTSGTVDVSFYFCPNPGDTPTPDKSGDKFTMSFKDSANNIGLQWGYARDNSVYWRDSPSNPWNATAFIADQNNWDGVRVSIDLTADTFSLDYFDLSANTWTPLAPAGTALGTALNDLTVLGWRLEDGLNAGPLLGKNFFDDFGFSVPIPEPSCALLMLLSAATLLYKRR
ncbi:hypothetical protein Pla111_13510 [Botrimarina hoheduenensis]|uniref:PEP-CTERM protein-sorting domain-containing protein n=2 Tax=Botrimarina hoheduenensis TaxID=2528000 RepID=A0A5C5WCG5_9BACT|nr:hypothetical protein Pla111_13510 [Botrimarina hoheduenensis]